MDAFGPLSLKGVRIYTSVLFFLDSIVDLVPVTVVDQQRKKTKRNLTILGSIYDSAKTFSIYVILKLCFTSFIYSLNLLVKYTSSVV